MQKREKILLYSFIGLIVLWQGQGIVDSLFFQPVSERKAKIQRLEDAISDQKIKERELELAVQRMKQAALRSLPPDPLIASSLYQNWLIELSTKAKLGNIAVTANRIDAKPVGNTYYVILATVKAQATLDQLCEFLYRFHESGLLQRVVRISVEGAQHDGNPPLNVTVFVEALSLVNSPARKTLLADASKPLGPDRLLKSRQDYAKISDKNVFVRGYNGPPPPAPSVAAIVAPPPPSTEPPFDAAAFVYLIAALSNEDGVEAWLYDRSSNKRTVLTEKTNFAVAGVNGRILTIGNDFVTLQIDGTDFKLELGENLRQMQKINKPSPLAAP